MDIKSFIKREIKALFELKQTERLWHIPLLASLCMGIPLLVGLYFGRLNYGILSSIGGLVILYLPTSSVAARMITILACSFGFMISLTVGIVFSFNPIVASIVLGLFSGAVYRVVNYFEMKPPAGFFFTMIASITICSPFDLSTVPVRVGLMGLGTMFACLLAFIYSLYITPNRQDQSTFILSRINKYSHIWHSVIIGVFAGFSLFIGHLFHLQNPYWVPVSCLAVMQGLNTEHVWQRSFQRILGTFIGMGLIWGLLFFELTPLRICIAILILQFIVEMLVVRHYALAVIFITPLTVFMAEASSAMSADPNVLIPARLLDIIIGSIIGAIGGWLLYHKQLRNKAQRQIRKAKVTYYRNNSGRKNRFNKKED